MKVRPTGTTERPALRAAVLGAGALGVIGAWTASASNHREAPITALDHKADITDLYAFVSYEGVQQMGTTPESVTIILNVDPLLEPANGPTLFPFDPSILYEIKVDNDHDALADKVFQFRFETDEGCVVTFRCHKPIEFSRCGTPDEKDVETLGDALELADPHLFEVEFILIGEDVPHCSRCHHLASTGRITKARGQMDCEAEVSATNSVIDRGQLVPPAVPALP